MYRPYNDYTEDLARYVFLEDASWSLIYRLDWVLYFDITEFDYQNSLKTIFLKNTFVVSVFWISEGGSRCLLVIFKKNSNIDGILPLLVNFKQTNDFNLIFDFICRRDWSQVDFNKTILIWHPAYQQCVGTLIDSISGGVIGHAPESWLCIVRGGESPSLNQEDLKRIEENTDIFLNWCRKYKPLNKFRFSIEFLLWFSGSKGV